MITTADLELIVQQHLQAFFSKNGHVLKRALSEIMSAFNPEKKHMNRLGNACMRNPIISQLSASLEGRYVRMELFMKFFDETFSKL